MNNILAQWSFPSGSAVKNQPAMKDTQETWVLSLGQEDFLEEEMAIHSSILAGKIPWTEEPGRPQAIGLQRVRHLTFIICYLTFIIILKEMHLLLTVLYW